jgi:hypothetical protein
VVKRENNSSHLEIENEKAGNFSNTMPNMTDHATSDVDRKNNPGKDIVRNELIGE